MIKSILDSVFGTPSSTKEDRQRMEKELEARRQEERERDSQKFERFRQEDEKMIELSVENIYKKFTELDEDLREDVLRVLKKERLEKTIQELFGHLVFPNSWSWAERMSSGWLLDGREDIKRVKEAVELSKLEELHINKAAEDILLKKDK